MKHFDRTLLPIMLLTFIVVGAELLLIVAIVFNRLPVETGKLYGVVILFL